MRGRLSSLALAVLVAASSAPARAAGDADAKSGKEEGAEPVKTPAQLGAEKHYKRARELYSLGRYREAIAQLEAALELDPKGAELLYNLGLVHEKLGDADEAIDAYKRYLKVLGNDVDPEERKKIESGIRRLEGAKAELKAREAKQTEHRFTPLSTGLAIGGSVSFIAALIFGGMALDADKKARAFVVGSGGGIDDRQALIDKSKRNATLADVFGFVGLAAGGAAITLYFLSDFPKADDPSDTHPPPPKTTSMLTLRPLGTGGAGVNWEMAF